MSYINLEVYKNSGLQGDDLVYLFSAKQIEKDMLETMSEDVYNRLQTLSLIKHINAPKKDNPLHSVRLSEKGLELFKELSEASILEEDKTVGDWLCDYYIKAGKTIGNKKKLFRHIKDFRVKSGIQKNNLIRLCTEFLRENEDKSNKLEFVFFHPKNVFEVKLDLDGSWLYQFYLENREKLDVSFEEY